MDSGCYCFTKLFVHIFLFQNKLKFNWKAKEYVTNTTGN